MRADMYVWHILIKYSSSAGAVASLSVAARPGLDPAEESNNTPNRHQIAILHILCIFLSSYLSRIFLYAVRFSTTTLVCYCSSITL